MQKYCRLVHADAVEILNTYADLFPDMLDSAAETLGDMLAPIVKLAKTPSRGKGRLTWLKPVLSQVRVLVEKLVLRPFYLGFYK